jgi:hypothetical protein
MLSMLAFVTVVYLTDRKKRITAIVFNMALEITNFLLLGIKDILFFRREIYAINIPKKNLKNVISIGEISELFVTNFAKTVADAKHNSARSSNIIPLYINSNAYFYGTGSYPCPPQGWHEKNLFVVNMSPLNGPCFLKASIE